MSKSDDERRKEKMRKYIQEKREKVKNRFGRQKQNRGKKVLINANQYKHLLRESYILKMPHKMLSVKMVNKHRLKPVVDPNDYFGLLRKDSIPKNWENLKLGQKQVYQMIGLHDSIVEVKIPKRFKRQ